MRNDLFLEMYTIFYISPGNHNLRDEVWDHVCLSQNKVQNILAILLGIQVGQIVTKKKFGKTEQVARESKANLCKYEDIMGRGRFATAQLRM